MCGVTKDGATKMMSRGVVVLEVCGEAYDIIGVKAPPHWNTYQEEDMCTPHYG